MLRLCIVSKQLFHFWRSRHQRIMPACLCALGPVPIQLVQRYASPSARHHDATHGVRTSLLPKTHQAALSIVHSHPVQSYAQRAVLRIHALSVMQSVMTPNANWNVALFRNVMRCARSHLADGNVGNQMYARSLDARCPAKPQRRALTYQFQVKLRFPLQAKTKWWSDHTTCHHKVGETQEQ